MNTSRYYRRLHLLVGFTILVSFISCNQKNSSGDNIHNIILHNDNGISDSFTSYMFDKGLVYLEQNKYMHAKECFSKADSASPNTPVILNALGNIAARADNDSLASLYFEKALQIDSNFIKTYNNYGSFLNGKRQFEEAKRIFYLGLSRQPKYDIDKRMLYCNLADSYFELNQKAIAIKFIDSAKSGLSGGEIYDQIIAIEKQIKSEY